MIKFKKLFIFIVSLFTLMANSSIAESISQSDLLFKEATDAVKSKKYLKAINIFEQLANDSEADAQYNLAILLKSGKGKPQDYRTSLKWAWLSLLGEIREAEKLVADLKDVLPEPALKQIRNEVKTYINDRAERGQMGAINKMGDYFLVVPENADFKGAYLWFLIAAAFQLEGSIEKRDRVEREIESKDILKIQANALDIFKKISDTVD